MSLPSTMRSIPGALNTRLRGADAFTLGVVFTGKVKPLEFALHEVLSDGLRLSPFPAGQPIAFYPFTSMTSIEIVEAEAAPSPLSDLTTDNRPEETQA